MKLFLQSAVVFFGALAAAALMAMGAPADAEVEMAAQARPEIVAGLFGSEEER